MRDFKPRLYQEQIIEHIVEHERCAVFARMGAGKTVSVLTALDGLLTAGDLTRPTLVIAPKRVANGTWPREAEKWSHLRHIEAQSLVGSEATRLAALRNPNASVFSINYDNLQWLVDTCGSQWPFEMVVADESTRLKGFRLTKGTRRAAALAKVAFHPGVKRWINLTGTPSPNGVKDLWGQTWFLDRGVRLGRTYSAFIERWFRVGRDGFSVEAMPGAQQQIEARLRDLCITIDPADYLPVDKPNFVTVDVELPAKAMQDYKHFEKEMFMQLQEGDTVEAFNAAALSIKCLQLANGAVYVDELGDERRWSEVHDAKLDALESIIEEACGAPVLVAYHFKSDLARLQKRFPQGRVLDDDPRTEDRWNAGEIPVLFAHPASAGHGLNLQDGGCIGVFFAHWWDAELYEQFIERIGPLRQLQSGHPRPVTIYHIVAKGTLDQVVVDRRITKVSVQDALLEAMKR